MNENFDAKELRMACEEFRKDANNTSFNKMLHTLMSTNFICPATWDKEPQKTEDGRLLFEANTKFQLNIVNNPNKDNYFPIFTNIEELRKFSPNKDQQSLVLTYPQYLPFIKTFKEQVKGIVIDPFGINVPISCEILLKMHEMSHLRENAIHKGDKIRLREPQENITELQRALCRFGDEHPEIQSIYLKERFVEDQPTHWFLIVETENEDPQIFQELGLYCQSAALGKEFEFIFGSMKLAQEIMSNSVPTFVKVPAA